MIDKNILIYSNFKIPEMNWAVFSSNTLTKYFQVYCHTIKNYYQISIGILTILVHVEAKYIYTHVHCMHICVYSACMYTISLFAYLSESIICFSVLLRLLYIFHVIRKQQVYDTAVENCVKEIESSTLVFYSICVLCKYMDIWTLYMSFMNLDRF